MKKFSIIVPVYFNEANLPETIPQLLALGNELKNYELELIFVDDGSKDRSLEILLDFQKKNEKVVKVVKLNRNFGAMAAIQAGLVVAGGDCIGVIAADLQDPPELFIEMISYWENEFKAVLAIRSDREESKMQKFFSNTYYALIRRFAISNYPAGGFDFFLADKQVIQEVNRIHEKNTNLMSLVFWLGYRYVTIPYVRKRREKGVSQWTLSKKIKLFIDSFVAFSYAPIRCCSVLGFVIALGSFIYGGIVFLSWLLSGIHVKGFTTLALLLTFTSGIQMTILGVLGEYLWRTLDETRRRPNYVVDRIYGES